MRFNRIVLSIVLLIALVPTVEIAREEIVYSSITNAYKKAYPKIRSGMTSTDVKKIIGEPDRVDQMEKGETMHWDAAVHQGWLKKRIGLGSKNAHYSVSVAFTQEGKVTFAWQALGKQE